MSSGQYENKSALPVGTNLDNYSIVEVIGAGGFGITYRAKDIALDTDVAIKEYFPAFMAHRDASSHVVPRSDDVAEDYYIGLKGFVQEGRILAKLRHPNIVRVLRHFDANGTAYLVMEYEKGQSLREYLKQTPKPDEEFLLQLLHKVLDGLRLIHAHHYLHRDIKPANIYLRENLEPVLIDFGSARQAMTQASHSLTHIVSEGYAPIEQYPGEIKQTPATDLYALGATLYFIVTGVSPISSIQRFQNLQLQQQDPLSHAVDVAHRSYSSELLGLIDWLTELLPDSRPQSVNQVLEYMESGLRTHSLENAATAMTIKSIPRSKPSAGRPWPYLVGVMALLLFAGCSWYVYALLSGKDSDPATKYTLAAAPSRHVAGNIPAGAKPPAAKSPVKRSLSFPKYDPNSTRSAIPDPVPKHWRALKLNASPVTATIEVLSKSPYQGKKLLINDIPMDGLPFPPGEYKVKIAANRHQARVMTVKLGFVNKESKVVLQSNAVEKTVKIGSRIEKVHHYPGSDKFLIVPHPSGNTLHVFNAKTQAIETKTFNHDITPMAISPDSNKVILAGNGFWVWDLKNNRKLKELKGKQCDASNGFEYWIKNPNMLYCKARFGSYSYMLWDMDQVKFKKQYDIDYSTSNAIRFSYAKNWSLLVPTFDKKARIVDILSGATIREFDVPRPGDGHFSSDGNQVLFVKDNNIQIFDVQSGNAVYASNNGDFMSRYGPYLFDRDGGRLIAVYYDYSIHIWNLKTGKREHILSGHKDTISYLGYLDSRKRLISASYDGTIKIWKLPK